MAIAGDYSHPITVNGFSCRNCAQVAQAKQFIDPAHPKSGPYGVSAASDPTVSALAKQKAAATDAAQAVTFGGNLAGLGSRNTPAAAPTDFSGLVFDKVA